MMGDTFPKKYDVVIFCFLNPRKNVFQNTAATAEGGLTLIKPDADVTLVLDGRILYLFFAPVTVDTYTSTSADCFVKVGGLLLKILFVFFFRCLVI